MFRGTVTGTLADEPRGISGFGFDPIFIPDDSDVDSTFAQMTSEEKNKISTAGAQSRQCETAWGCLTPLPQGIEAA